MPWDGVWHSRKHFLKYWKKFRNNGYLMLAYLLTELLGKYSFLTGWPRIRCRRFFYSITQTISMKTRLLSAMDTNSPFVAKRAMTASAFILTNATTTTH